MAASKKPLMLSISTFGDSAQVSGRTWPLKDFLGGPDVEGAYQSTTKTWLISAASVPVVVQHARHNKYTVVVQNGDKVETYEPVETPLADNVKPAPRASVSKHENVATAPADVTSKMPSRLVYARDAGGSIVFDVPADVVGLFVSTGSRPTGDGTDYWVPAAQEKRLTAMLAVFDIDLVEAPRQPPPPVAAQPATPTQPPLELVSMPAGKALILVILTEDKGVAGLLRSLSDLCEMEIDKHLKPTSRTA